MLLRGMATSTVSGDRGGWAAIVSPKHRESQFNDYIYQPMIHSFSGDSDGGKVQQFKRFGTCLPKSQKLTSKYHKTRQSLTAPPPSPLIFISDPASDTLESVPWCSPSFLYYVLLRDSQGVVKMEGSRG